MLARLLYAFLLLLSLACTSRKENETKQNQPTAKLRVGNAEEGKKLFTTCVACHGDAAQGNKQMHAPALANADNWYLYRQLMNFKKGIRGNSEKDTLGIQMAGMANTLLDSIAVSNVVAYIKTLPAIELPVQIKGDIKKGERAYQSVCGSCHGQGAKGNEMMNAPRLNGVDDWYLKHQISKFKNSIRGSHPKDTYGQQMVPMAALLADEQAVNDVIAYIRSTTHAKTE